MLAGVVLLAVAALLPGCLSIEAASGGRMEARTLSLTGMDDDAGVGKAITPAPDATVWPRRWGDEIDGLGKGVIVPVAGPLEAWSPRRHGPWHSRLPKGNDEAFVRALAKGRAGEGGYRYRLEQNGAFVFERDPEIPEPPEGRPADRSEPSAMFVFVSGRVEGADANGQTDVGIDRTWFAFYDHRRDGRPDAEDPGIGTVMLLPGLFGIPEPVVDVVTSTMRQRGWNVIRMLAPPARFVEKTEIEIDPDAPESARAAAAELMHRVAETAYASEAAWGHVLALRPSLADRPKVAFAGSGGALALPAVLRRDRERYDGAVLIAGGANILEVVTRSTYTRPVDALDFAWSGYEWGETPPDGVIGPVTEEYLRHAPLDGYHARAWIGDLPLLILEASADKAVPTANSDLLWSRLDRPERWTIQGNHLTLFLSLWLHTPRILDWAEKAVLHGGEP